jgi:hypothetical protein
MWGLLAFPGCLGEGAASEAPWACFLFQVGDSDLLLPLLPVRLWACGPAQRPPPLRLGGLWEGREVLSSPKPRVAKFRPMTIDHWHTEPD